MLVPAYNEEAHVGTVIASLPEYVDLVVVVDDASTDATAAVASAIGDPRVRLIRHPANSGLGASLVTAHRAAMDVKADISVVMAGDGQMDPAHLSRLLDPIVDQGYDFTKGNRFYARSALSGMPRHRILGSVVLSLLTKAATGYWSVFDPQNGYTAMARSVQERIDWDGVARDYSFENDVLAHLALIRARVRDVDIPAVYEDEVSHMRVMRVVPGLLRTLARAFVRRMWRQHLGGWPTAAGLLGAAGVGLLAWSLLERAWMVLVRTPAAADDSAHLQATAALGAACLLAGILLDVAVSPR